VVKKIYDSDKVIEAEHINGYLMDRPDVWVESRTKPICDVPVMMKGSQPTDGGNFLFSSAEYLEFLKKEPLSESLFRPFLGSEEFIKNIPRWCLWLKGVSPKIINSLSYVKERVANVRDMRLKSPKAATRKKADIPFLFDEIRQPESGNYLLVPSVSSERREYVPMGFMDSNTIASNLVLIVPSATLYHFGVLTSSVHMAWMRTVCGRLKSDYRYSANIVYNNFPWPEGLLSPLGDKEIGSLGEDSKKSPNLQNSKTPSSESNNTVENITKTAQAILDARALYHDSSLADLYDPLTMPPELRKAHAANDAAVMKAYGYAPTMTEPEIVADLMKRYQQLTVKDGCI
jgi:hypothetical protein